MKFLKNATNLTEIEVVLTDFGLAGSDSKGGTPLFASPESFAVKGRKQNCDVFSLGRVFLFLLHHKEQFLEFLYIPLHEDEKSQIMNLIEQEPILKLIRNMMRIEERPTVSEVRAEFEPIVVMNNHDVEIQITKLLQTSTSEDTKQYINNLKHFS